MARRVFFSFEYEHDIWRAMVVRNSWLTQDREAAGFQDAAAVEQIQRQGDAAVRRWIKNQLHGTSVTVVLAGSHTCSSRWVRYEIEQSEYRRNGLLGIDISKIEDRNGSTTWRCGEIPHGHPFFLWNRQNGYDNMGDWIEEAARIAGR